MIKFWEWITRNWEVLALILLGVFMFSLIGPITKFARQAKDGVKESFTPLGAFITLCLIAFFIFLAVLFKSALRR